MWPPGPLLPGAVCGYLRPKAVISRLGATAADAQCSGYEVLVTSHYVTPRLRAVTSHPCVACRASPCGRSGEGEVGHVTPAPSRIHCATLLVVTSGRGPPRTYLARGTGFGECSITAVEADCRIMTSQLAPVAPGPLQTLQELDRARLVAPVELQAATTTRALLGEGRLNPPPPQVYRG